MFKWKNFIVLQVYSNYICKFNIIFNLFSLVKVHQLVFLVLDYFHISVQKPILLYNYYYFYKKKKEAEPIRCYSNNNIQAFQPKTNLANKRFRFRLMVFNATFNNISVISWRLVLLMEESRVPGENHRPVASYRQTAITKCCIQYTSP